MSNAENDTDLQLSEYEAIIAGGGALLDAVPAAVYVCDRNGLLISYNAEAARLWGRYPRIRDPRDRFCGSLHLYLLDGSSLPHDSCPVAEAVRSGKETRNGEVVMERPDGSRFEALVNVRALRDRDGRIEGAINCFQDISSQKALERQANRHAADLEDFFENAAVGLHIVSNEGIILRANKAELELLGYTAEEYVGKHIASFHVDARAIADILDKLSCGRDLDRYPARLRAKNGQIKHVLITSNSRFEDGRFINTRCFTTDVTDVHQAELARLESEERLAATYQAATIGIAEADSAGRLLRVNDALCRMLGRSEDELLAMTFLDYTHAEDKKQDAERYAQQVEGKIDSYVLRKQAIKPDGTSVYLDVHSSSVRDAKGEFRYGVRVLIDVTKAKRMEDRIRENERNLRDLLEALPAAVYTTDADGRITFFNRAAVEMAGRVPALGDEWCVTWRLFRTDGTFLPHDQCPMAVAIKEDRPIRGEEAVAERPDGTRVPFIPYPTPLHDSEGRLTGAINMLVDISDRKKAEEFAERLAAIVTFSDDAIVSKDTQGIIQTWNKGAERLFGYTAADVIGKPITILIPPERQDEEPEILARICRGEHIEHYETVRMKKDGSLIDVSLTVSPLKDGKGQIIGASKIARDITEKRQEERRHLLLINELNHRVKNTLATVQSLASQTFRGERDNHAFRQFESRLVALARAHDLLTQESWQGADLHEILTRSLQAVCLDPGRQLEVSGPPCRLNPKLALSLSMAFHELGANATKHGALSVDGGKVAVHWSIDGSGEGKTLHLTWRELHGPSVTAAEKRGFGSRLLEQALARELDAQVLLSFPESGVNFSLTAPLPASHPDERNKH
ncbi:UNVERIFIED_ORG: PAS domain S-box-containing protein [Rhizobium sp. SORGH_AS260]|uniref:PAS domain S-box protein n=1 Tax=Agrobacterium sp. SORGH_AS_0440 TaxID=3041757 RepID=UPI002782BC84|nr:PAS domain S-box protein [Agrobacterium sp. SORGH_AS_0440]MDP9734820.1 PAS domain S-box-containing protein [Rhizobium sp. SORGH_AS_0285]MDP9757039.1 PAS domain S-box-containing protein [Rhizobium sp. SORGH_AS_0260]MDR6083712.1 PAS domain S-box-containing protein [Agrobacterium sp. SORGH_AS_0440]